MAQVCGLTIDSATTEAERIASVNHLGIHDVVRLHPSDQFWVPQAWESAVFLAAAGLLAVACFW
jgi:hypothetical protein